MVPLQLLCRTLNRHLSGSYVFRCQPLLPSIVKQHFNYPCHPISTSPHLDREISMPYQRGTSIFSAGSSKQRAIRNQNHQLPSNGDRTPSTQTIIPLPAEPLGSEGWQQLNEKYVFKETFEQKVIEQMIKSDANLEVAKSLLCYVAKKDGDLSYSLLVKYLVLCIKCNDAVEICDVYDILRMKYPTLDTGAYCLLIKGLSRTERWRESLDILESMKKLTSVSARNYGDCIIAALKHHDYPLAWSLYDELLLNNFIPPQDVLQSFFNVNQDLQDDGYRKRLFDILQYYKENQIYPEESLMESIKSWFESIPNATWRGKLTKITDCGHCQACKHHLESIQLTAKEYDTLKNAVIDSIIKGEDTFRKTTPRELQEFLQFVKTRPPFDIVVDGLNVAYLTRNSIPSQALLRVVSALAAKGKRVLVLGRVHMLIPSKKWIQQDIQCMQGFSDCFFLDNISLDDPFLLYACMHSGSHCCFLTSDLLRDHKACLPDAETQRLFFKWQRGHQLVLPFNISGCLPLRPILTYDTILQSTATSWHIPYDIAEVKRTHFEVPRTWLCLQKRQ